MFRSIFMLLLITVFFQTSSYAAEDGLIEFKAGVSYFKKKKYKSALIYFRKALNKGMKKNTLRFNLGVTYYKLKQYNEAEKNFILLTRKRRFRQIAFYNLGLIAEKRKMKKTAISWYKKSAENNENNNISQLAHAKLDKLLNRKTRNKNKTRAHVSLSFGSDDNVTSAASNSPSNKSDTYIELFAYAKTAITAKINVKGSIYQVNYDALSTEDFNFFSAGIDYLVKTKSWNLTPEISLMNSTLNDTSYQSIIDYKLTAKRKLNKTSGLALRYRYSDIDSKKTAYNYLQGTRHQFRIDYKNIVKMGKLRLRYQLETNDRQNTITANYSPTRHAIRARLKHKIGNGWNLSEELAYRISTYGSVASVTREDTRLRLRVVASKKINKEWAAGIRYTHTNNDSNIVSENYSRNNIQVFSSWGF